MLRKNRDAVKKNRSNLAVRGCMYGKLGQQAVELLAQKVKRRKLLQDSNSDMEDRAIVTLLEITRKSNQHLVDCLTLSQEAINKRSCKRYADTQHSLMVNSLTYKEDIEEISDISEHIVNDSIKNLYIDLYNVFCQSEGM